MPPARRGRPWPAPSPPSASSAQLFFQEGSDLGQPAADAGQPLDSPLGLAGTARRVLNEVAFQGLLMLVQLAVLAPPAEAANPLEAAFQELVEVALDGARRDVGELGDVGVGQAAALQPQHLHLALDSGMGMLVTLVANLCQDFLAEDELAHGCLPAIGI